MSSQNDVVTVERMIAAPPGAIFALLVDPSRHQDIDGSETVRDVKGDTKRLELGTTFGMSMHRSISYSTVNTVIEYDENRRFAWQTRGAARIVANVGGQIWRYELEAVDDGTLVRESWDLTQATAFIRPLVRRAASQTRENMTATLARIDELVTS